MTPVEKLHAGRYEVFQQIGRGRFKDVWFARDTIIERPVALAFLREEDDHQFGGSLKFRELFRKEALVLSRLTRDLPRDLAKYKHRVVEFTDYGELTGSKKFKGPYLATAFIEGQTLRKLRKVYPISWQRAINLTSGILEALEISHANTPHRGPIIHRDISPANIIINSQDKVTVFDFGIAKHTQNVPASQSAFKGTLEYMAPEQAVEGAAISHQADLYAVGVILFEMLLNKRPWNLLHPAPQHTKNLFPELDELDCPPQLKEIIRSALEIQADNRPATANIMKKALQKILRDAEPLVAADILDSPSIMPRHSTPMETKSGHRTAAETIPSPLTNAQFPPRLITSSEVSSFASGDSGASQNIFLYIAASIAIITVGFAAFYLSINSKSSTPQVIETQVANTSEAQKLLDSAKTAISSELPNKAIRSLEVCTDIYPENAECHKELGLLHESMGNPVQAKASLERYLELLPGAEDKEDITQRLKTL